MSELIDRDALILDLMDRGLDQVQTGDGSEVIQVINAQPTASPWHRVEDGDLPKETGRYIVYLRQGTEVETPEWMGGEPLSYVTEMGFDKGQMLWQEGDDAYNAVLDLVDTEKEFHVTHWMENPEPPKEDAYGNK